MPPEEWPTICSEHFSQVGKRCVRQEFDQICPFPASGASTIKLLKRGTLKTYPGFPHGMPATNADQINADILEFIKR